MNKQELKSLIKECVQMALSENIKDPTKEEMLQFLQQQFGGFGEEGFKDDAEAAMYWFANFNHGGQDSNLYSVLSTSTFSPGPIARGPQKDSMEADMYQALEAEYGGKEHQHGTEPHHPGEGDEWDALQEDGAVGGGTGMGMSVTGAVQGYQTPKAFQGPKKKVDEMTEEDNEALYVEYLREMPGETPFELGGKKWQYVMAKYPSGKEDIGVYAFAGDLVYGYNAWRQMHNIKEDAEMSDPSGEIAPGPRDRFEMEPGKPAERKRTIPPTVNKGKIQKAFDAVGQMKQHEWHPLLNRAKKNYDLFPDDGNDPQKLNLAMALQYMDEHPEQFGGAPLRESMVPKRIIKLRDLLK